MRCSCLSFLAMIQLSLLTWFLKPSLQFNEMGEVIEPFNLKDEREAGGFDENMNYVFQKEKGEVDAW